MRVTENHYYRHLKSGGIYKVLMTKALLEKTLEPQVVYQSMSVGTVFIRSMREFSDGRFEHVFVNFAAIEKQATEWLTGMDAPAAPDPDQPVSLMEPRAPIQYTATSFRG